MKKLFLINILFICALSISAQIKVQNTGYVGVGSSVLSGTLLSPFSINSLGEAGVIAYIQGSPIGLKINTSALYDGYGLYAKATGCQYGTAIGVLGEGQTIAPGMGCFRGNGVGVRGIAGASTTTFMMYGVSGLVDGTNGAGIYGRDNTSETAFQGKWAGYFKGNVHVDGTLTAVSINPSDSRLKKNVLDLDYQRTLDRIMLLRPVEYNMQQVTFEVADSVDSRGEVVTTRTVNRYDETTAVFQNKHYGLIAQEVQRIYPDLVYEGSDGYLGIDYVSLIPMLLKVVQQQQVEIDQLKRNESAPHNAPAKPQETTNQSAALYQNTPNPFNENTEIAFYLPQSVTNAMLCVYDMNGKQLSQNVITQRGNASFVVNGNKYGAGMYLYSLIADNQIVDTKRMILTK